MVLGSPVDCTLEKMLSSEGETCVWQISSHSSVNSVVYSILTQFNEVPLLIMVTEDGVVCNHASQLDEITQTQALCCIQCKKFPWCACNTGC